jgi:hypothetical protein
MDHGVPGGDFMAIHDGIGYDTSSLYLRDVRDGIPEDMETFAACGPACPPEQWHGVNWVSRISECGSYRGHFFGPRQQNLCEQGGSGRAPRL